MLSGDLIRSAGISVTFASLTEFITAQSPHQLRGIVIAYSLGFWSTSTLVQFILGHFSKDFCIPYLVITVVTFGIFVLFIFVSRRYKLRKRNDVILYHMFAENEFESNYRQERDYLRKIGWTY